MKNKKLIILLILLFPACFKLILDFATVNSRKLPYFGPKKLNGSDTVYYQVDSVVKELSNDSLGLKTITLDTINFPVYVVSFIKQSYTKDNYRLASLSEYIQFKKDKIKYIPIVIVSPCDGNSDVACLRDLEKLTVDNPNIHSLYWNNKSFDSLNVSYFKEKPTHVDYSTFVLIDKKRNIRGYYDARYADDFKRLIEEYQYLRMKEEQIQIMNNTKIEKR